MFSQELPGIKSTLANVCSYLYVARCIQPLTTAKSLSLSDGPTFRIRNAKLRTEAAEVTSARVEFLLHTNRDVMILLTELLSNEYAFFAGVSKEWRHVWGDAENHASHHG